jgi:hypothetical protein
MSECTFNDTEEDGDLSNAANWSSIPSIGSPAVLAANATKGHIECASLDCTGFSCVCDALSRIAGNITVDDTNTFTWGDGDLCVAGVKAAADTATFTIAADGALASAASLVLASVKLSDVAGSVFSGVGTFAVAGGITCGDVSGYFANNTTVSAGGDIACGDIGAGAFAGNGSNVSAVGGITYGDCAGSFADMSTVIAGGDIAGGDCFVAFAIYTSTVTAGGDITCGDFNDAFAVASTVSAGGMIHAGPREPGLGNVLSGVGFVVAPPGE